MNKIDSADKFSSFYNVLEIKSPDLFGGILCFIYLQFFKDIIISDKTFLEKISTLDNINLNYSHFKNNYRIFINNFFTLDLNLYRAKLNTYVNDYVNIIKSKIHNTKYIKSLDTDFVEKTFNLLDLALNNGFEILKRDVSLYYPPQTMALSLILYVSRLVEDLQGLITFNSLKNFFNGLYNEENYSFGTITTNNCNRLYDFVKSAFKERYKGQNYNRETFIEALKKHLRLFYHFETDFLLQLFELTDFTPVEFAEKLNIYGGHPTFIVQIAKRRHRFSELHVFDQIQQFILTDIKGTNQISLLNTLNKLKKERGEDLESRGVSYPFRWFEDRILKISNKELSDILFRFLSDVNEFNFPFAAFKIPDSPRVSILSIVGTRSEKIELYELERFFNGLLATNIIEKFSSEFDLCSNCRDIFDIFNIRRMGFIPDHTPLLKYIFLNNNRSLAVEIPVWKRVSNSEIFTGHIDLLNIDRDFLVVCDYNPDFEDMLRNIPQVAAYGWLLNNNLLNYIHNSYDLKIKCLMFSRFNAYIFDPLILKTEILPFVNYLDSRRHDKLKSFSYVKSEGIKGYSRSERFLSEDIKMIIN